MPSQPEATVKVAVIVPLPSLRCAPVSDAAPGPQGELSDGAEFAPKPGWTKTASPAANSVASPSSAAPRRGRRTGARDCERRRQRCSEEPSGTPPAPPEEPEAAAGSTPLFDPNTPHRESILPHPPGPRLAASPHLAGLRRAAPHPIFGIGHTTRLEPGFRRLAGRRVRLEAYEGGRRRHPRGGPAGCRRSVDCRRDPHVQPRTTARSRNRERSRPVPSTRRDSRRG